MEPKTQHAKPFRIKAAYVNAEVVLYCPGVYRDGSQALRGLDFYTGEPLFVATVCVSDPPSQGCVWLKGWSENEGIPEALVEAGVVELTGRTCETGYCEAQEARLLI